MSNLILLPPHVERHMDNGRQLFRVGMEAAGYVCMCREIDAPGVQMVDVAAAVDRFNPEIVIAYPRYEWLKSEWGGGPEVARRDEFRNWGCLLSRSDILRVAVWHDAGSARDVQRKWHADFQPHAYLTWYHPDSVMCFAPHVRRDQIVRTYHVLSDNLPPCLPRDGIAVVSGAYTTDTYPLRTKCFKWAVSGRLGDGVHCVRHPGYTQSGTRSLEYAAMLGGYRVSICTASSYKFALRKIFESTAMGCVIVTDLPEYDCLPHIDGNLIRVHPSISSDSLREVVQGAAANYDFGRQKQLADLARVHYNSRTECARLSNLIEAKRDQLCCMA